MSFMFFTLPHRFNITCGKTENDSIEFLLNTYHRKEDGSKTMQRSFTVARAGGKISLRREIEKNNCIYASQRLPK